MEDYKKKYEQALERAKKYYNRELYAECNGSLVEDIFPELKESEDEKIRKELIDFVKSRLAGFSQCEKFITWLEKQGKQKPTWSEEDEKIMNRIISNLEKCSVPGFPIYVGEIELGINWLQSLKERMEGE